MLQHKRLIIWDWIGTVVTSKEQRRIDYALFLVKYFNKHGAIQVIASNATANIIESSIDDVLSDEERKFFSEIFTITNCKPKPDPDMLMRALDKSSVQSSDALMIGDGEIDKQAAIAACVDFRLVDGSYESYRKIFHEFSE
jgi:phosphoglycolate phosphatase-like HAD superfamily hydrolase